MSPFQKKVTQINPVYDVLCLDFVEPLLHSDSDRIYIYIFSGPDETHLKYCRCIKTLQRCNALLEILLRNCFWPVLTVLDSLVGSV